MIKQNDIFENVEYLLISYHGSPVITFEGKEVNGKSKAEIQYKLGSEYGEKNFNFSMKIKGKLKNETGGIRGIKIGSSNQTKNGEDLELNELRKEIKELKTNNNFDRIEKLIDEKYQIEIKHLNETIKKLEKDNAELEREYNSLVSQVEKSESNENNMLTSLLKLLPLDKLTGKGAALSDNISKQLDVRPEILNVLNEVDYTKLSDADINQYAQLLKQFTNSLPKKA